MHPAFALVRRKLIDLQNEFDLFKAAESLVSGSLAENMEPAAEWARNALRGTGIEGVYTGMEGILKDLVTATDGNVFAPAENWHFQLLAQAAAETPRRPPIISNAVYGGLNELRSFRHIERNVYRHAFRDGDVVRNVDVLGRVFPAFASEVEQFMKNFDFREKPREPTV
jgi:hypothetical protein